MITLILLAIFLIVPVTLIIVDYYKDIFWDLTLVAMWAIIAFLADLIVFCSLVNINREFDYTIEKYNNLKTLVVEYNEKADSTGYPELEYDIRKQVVEMNNEISKHKIMHDSPWNGPWYSEKVGNLPIITYKTRKN